MADIRINALATTASSTASDDFLAVDGSSQGTRKLNAFSPSFGGNATVGGNLTVSGTTGLVLSAGTPTISSAASNASISYTANGTGGHLFNNKIDVNSVNGVGKLNVRATTNANLHIRDASAISGTGVAFDALNDANSATVPLLLRGSTITLFGNTTIGNSGNLTVSGAGAVAGTLLVGATSGDAGSGALTLAGNSNFSMKWYNTGARAWSFEGGSSGNDHTTTFSNAGAGKHNVVATGNLTVSGTTGSSFGPISRTNGTNVTGLTLSDNLTGASTVGFGLQIKGTSNNGAVVSAIGFENGGSGTNNESQFSVYTQNTAGALTRQLLIGSTGNATLTGNLTASGTGNNIFNASGGNLLVGKSTPDGGQKLQVAGTADITGATTVGGTLTAGATTVGGTLTVQSNGPNTTHQASTAAAALWNRWLNSAGTRRGYYGYGSGGDSTFTIINEEAGSFVLGTNNATALTLDSSQNAKFAARIQLAQTDGAARGVQFTNNDASAEYGSLNYSTSKMRLFGNSVPIVLSADNGSTDHFSLATSGAATFTGAIAIGNTVNTVSPTSPNRTITMVIGGTTYYLHAKTTND